MLTQGDHKLKFTLIIHIIFSLILGYLTDEDNEIHMFSIPSTKQSVPWNSGPRRQSIYFNDLCSLNFVITFSPWKPPIIVFVMSCDDEKIINHWGMEPFIQRWKVSKVLNLKWCIVLHSVLNRNSDVWQDSEKIGKYFRHGGYKLRKCT